MNGKSVVRCRDCAYWLPLTPEEGPEPIEGRPGECRRHPGPPWQRIYVAEGDEGGPEGLIPGCAMGRSRSRDVHNARAAVIDELRRLVEANWAGAQTSVKTRCDGTVTDFWAGYFDALLDVDRDLRHLARAAAASPYGAAASPCGAAAKPDAG